jgi:hypothetical protein
VKLPRTEATASDRSITAQIEHWAKLGRPVETALGHDDVPALKVADGNLTSAFPGLSARQAVYTLLQQVAATTDRVDVDTGQSGLSERSKRIRVDHAHRA